MQAKAFRADADGLQDFSGEVGGDDGVVITNLVMTLSQLSPTHKNAISPIQKPIHQEDGIYPAGAHHPDHPDMMRVLNPGHPSRVRRGIAAPMAEKSKNFRFKCIHI